MEEKKKRGRKKKIDDLVKSNFYIAKELHDQIHELVKLTNEFKETDSITYSSMVRQCLATNIPKLLNAMKARMKEIQKINGGS